MKPKAKLWPLALKLAVAALLLAWLTAKFDVGPVLRQLLAVDLLDVLPVFGLIALQWLLFGVRWRLVASHFRAALPFAETMRIVLVSMFFAQTLPGTIGGDAARILLARRSGIPLKSTVVSVLADRLIGLFVLVGMVLLCLPLIVRIVADERVSAGLSYAVLAAAAGVVLTLLVGARVPALARNAALRSVFEFVAAVGEVLRERRLAPPILLVSVLMHLLSAFVALAIARAIQVEVRPLEFVALMLPVLFVMSVPVSIAGWGVREGAMVVALGYAGTGAPQALGISIAFGVVFALAGLPGALLWVAQGRRAPPLAGQTRE